MDSKIVKFNFIDEQLTDILSTTINVAEAMEVSKTSSNQSEPSPAFESIISPNKNSNNLDL